jgi:hypothetical protein
LIKFAAAAMLLVEDTRTGQHTRTADRARFQYTPKPGYVYVRSRMISSRTNENYDTFPADEIRKAWRTFIGKPVFVNHHNEDINRARGFIADAALHEDVNPNGTPDVWVEGLMAIDAVRFPKLAEAIVARDIERTSMGTAVSFTVCSFCGNHAETPLDYCKHIASMKGRRIIRTSESGAREAVLVSEICYGLGFFENSLLVEDPADPTAYAFGVDTRGVPELAKSAGRKQRAATKIGGSVRGLAQLYRPMDTRDDPTDWPVVRTAELLLEAAGPRWADPADHPYFQANPVSSDNIMAHWNRATPEDKDQGMNWYHGAHLVAKAIANGDPHKGAGVLAAYSPQTNWPSNMFNAARALESGKAIGGKGSGIFATQSMADQAQRIINGEPHPTVLKGPKIQDFAHLIEHDGDEDPSQPHAVIDRHAMSVATGRRLTDDEIAKAPIATRHYYGHVVNAYKQAADQISAQEGHPVAPHQVQAATWLVRQRENALADAASGTGMGKGRGTNIQNASNAWNDYAKERFPHLVGPGYHGASKVAHKVGYGEQVAPPEVNTLLPESCPICGNSDTWNSNQCMECGYEAPPEPFDSPDLDRARQDLGQAEQDIDQAATPADGQQPSQPLQDGQQALPQDAQPPLYVGQRSIPRNTVERNTGMTSNSAVRANIHKRLDEQQKQINGFGGLLAAIASRVGVTAADVPPQFQKSDDDSGSSTSDSGSDSSSDSGPDKDSAEYKAGYADGKAGNEKDGSGTDYDAGYSAGQSAGDDSDSDSDSSSDSDSDDDSDKTSSVARRRRQAYLQQRRAHRRTAEGADATSNETARQPAAKDDPSNIGAVPSSANTNVTPDATTSVDSAPTSTTLETDDSHKIDVEAPTPGVDDPPSADGAKVPQDITVGTPANNTDSYNTGGPDNISWTAAREDPKTRLLSAIKLAKLRQLAGLDAGEDEMVLAQRICDDRKMPLAAIAVEAGALNRVITAAQARQAQRSAANRNLVPQNRTAERTRPSLAAPQGIVATASTGEISSEEFGDLG